MEVHGQEVCSQARALQERGEGSNIWREMDPAKKGHDDLAGKDMARKDLAGKDLERKDWREIYGHFLAGTLRIHLMAAV